jgi:hypothetical protein
MLYQEFISLTNSKVSHETYTNKIEPAYMKSPLDKQEFCRQYIEQSKKPRINKSNKFEYDGYTHCKSLKTAYNRLKQILTAKGYPDALGYDNDFIESLSKGEKTHVDKYHSENWSSFWTYNQYQLNEYFRLEDGTFFRIDVENIDGDLWYVDCGFTITDNSIAN